MTTLSFVFEAIFEAILWYNLLLTSFPLLLWVITGLSHFSYLDFSYLLLLYQHFIWQDSRNVLISYFSRWCYRGLKSSCFNFHWIGMFLFWFISYLSLVSLILVLRDSTFLFCKFKLSLHWNISLLEAAAVCHGAHDFLVYLFTNLTKTIT